MIIKKFVAKTESEATAEAKRELGPGIVIMNVRPVKQEGFLAFLRPPRVEVTVALEDEPDDVPLNRPQTGQGRSYQPSQKAREEISAGERLVKATQEGKLPPLGGTSGQSAQTVSPRPQNDSPRIDLTAGGSDQDNRGAARADRERAGAEKSAERASDDARAKKEIGQRRSGGEDMGVLEEKLDSLHSLLEERIGGPASKNTAQGQDTKDGAGNKEAGTSGEMLTFVKLLYNTLISNEVDEIYANQLTDEVEKINKPNLPLEYILANVYQKMVLKFGKSEIITPAESGPKAIFFIGPTGVGKTTTIAKLASELYVMQHKKVALLTVDTYRIAAAEQLKTYASIMEIPCRVIYSVEEMAQAAEDFKSYDFLCIDTAGHSMHNEEQKKTVDAFLHAFDGIIPSEVFLVLSATTKYRDLTDITDSYSAMTKYKLLFTKMDETSAAGNLYNIKLRTGAPMSYITNGQNVPDDIAVFDAQAIVKGLLGGRK